MSVKKQIAGMWKLYSFYEGIQQELLSKTDIDDSF